MVIRRGGAPNEESSSSDDEDAFSALSNKGNIKTNVAKALPIVPATTSSMKRHHIMMSDTRKAKMDAIIQDLEIETDFAVRKPSVAPKGSFVQPGEEHLTTNIFLSNLCPSLTEKQVMDMFSQFGPLYSLKIMWPRTPEERARNRNTGFVSFVHRADADAAMDACSDKDPFRVGRRLMMRWGKNVKTEKEQVDRNNSEFLIKRPKMEHIDAHSVVVVSPNDPRRRQFITRVASVVAKNGPHIENQILDKELHNSEFNFLRFNPNGSETEKVESIYYRWKVYSLGQGDSPDVWKTEPFVMIDDGRTWIPPPQDNHTSIIIEEAPKGQSDESFNREFVTGRQLERREGQKQLRPDDEIMFQTLVRIKLTASRKSICEATAFCFEKSGAAERIAFKLKEILLESDCSIDTRVARLFLLSDVLFNSQQPGIKNAFRYRDAVERMSPEIFASLGKHGEHSNLGRMRLNKLKTAVNGVLSAWTNWSVFDHTFIDELEARFEGREVVKSSVIEEVPVEDKVEEFEETTPIIFDRPRGEFTEVSDEPEVELLVDQPPIPAGDIESNKSTETKKRSPATQGEIEIEHDDDIDGESLAVDELDEETLRLLDEDYFIIPDAKVGDYRSDIDDIDGEPVTDSELKDAVEEVTMRDQYCMENARNSDNMQ